MAVVPGDQIIEAIGAMRETSSGRAEELVERNEPDRFPSKLLREGGVDHADLIPDGEAVGQLVEGSRVSPVFVHGSRQLRVSARGRSEHHHLRDTG